MRKRKQIDPHQPDIPGMRQVLADLMAENLIAHEHDCYVRRATLYELMLMGLTESEFLSRWARGDYDA